MHSIHGVAAFLSRFIVLTRDEIRWHHDASELNSNTFIGRAKLAHIYDTMRGPKQQGPKKQGIWSLRVNISMHQTMKKKEAGRRTLIFGCESELIRDKWLAAIDYLKTKAMFDLYQKKNSLVNFMGYEKNDDVKEHEEEELDINDLLYEFGMKLK